MTPEQIATRGRLASEVLENEVFQQAFTDIEQEVIRLWRDSRDAKDREHLHQLLMMLSKVRTVLESAMRSGKVATADLQRKASLSERIGRRLNPA